MRKAVSSVQEYAEALDWLFVNTSPARLESIIEGGGDLTSACLLILDIYWISEAKLRHDLKRRWYPERYHYRREVA